MANAAVRGEMVEDEYEEKFFSDKVLGGYFVHGENRLVKQVYNQSKREYLRRNRNNWVKHIHRLVQRYNLTELWEDEKRVWEGDGEDRSSTGRRKFWLRQIFKSIHRAEENEWRKEVESKPKLRAYIKCKEALELEKYLTSETDRRGTFLLTTLRTGTNKLRIEIGRRKKPRKEPEEERVCMVCMSGSVENEAHFLLSCEGYEDLREELFRGIWVESGAKWAMEYLTPEAQWKVLMGGTKDKFEGKIFEMVKNFLRLAYKRRGYRYEA